MKTTLHYFYTKNYIYIVVSDINCSWKLGLSLQVHNRLKPFLFMTTITKAVVYLKDMSKVAQTLSSCLIYQV